MAQQEIPSDIAALSFEAALEELRTIVQSLEGGEGKLEEAIEAYERGAALKRHCDSKLREAQEKIEKVALANGAPVGSEPLDPA